MRLDLLAIGIAFAALAACHREPVYEGRTISAWLEALQSNTPAERVHAVAMITRYAPDHPEAAGAVIDALAIESDTSVHVALAAAVGALAEAGPEVKAGLVRLLEDRHPPVRMAAIGALESLGHRPDSEGGVLADLVPMTRDSDHDVRTVAARAVSRLVGDSIQPPDAVLLALERMILSDPVPSVRGEVASLLSEMELPDSVASRMLPSVLQSPHPAGQRAALRWLEAAGEVPMALRPRVTELTESADPAVQESARRLVQRFPRRPIR